MVKKIPVKKEDLSPQFLNVLKEWIIVNKQIEDYNNQIKLLKTKKEKLEAVLIPYMTKNNLEKQAILYQDRKICVHNEKTYTNLSYKFIKGHLENYFDQSEMKPQNKLKMINDIIEYLKSQREIKTVKTMSIN